MSQVVKNTPSPGTGGDDFEKYQFPQLAGIDAWYGYPDGVLDLRGLRLRFRSRDLTQYGTAKGSPDAHYDFDPGEKVTSMDIWGTEESVSGIHGGFVTGIGFNTTKQQNVLLGGNSQAHPTHQTVGNGTFVGLTGRAGSDIDALGGVFAN
ncbi:hypothetical protein BGW36DRAFT_71876 [Talaromyces proteolyticus]|uniref:Jacalin-type lectin domain-containing protein n=1 Tax=Talaromyces proteolyticus TaxID=1131652 RepID=A0AAD4KIT6_9EURO|nr:uncharacterized protein BGW36DRAFT_71876 [Talaromyces proteolyticus]KAH8689495.1 hypothetical protein BGW36DRAFT_71876 [Talaromyces proteolyticus]